MRARILTLVGVGVAVVVGLVGSTQIGLMGQTAGAQADASLRTPWGEPDLQGIWTQEFDTPLERPEGFGNRGFYTDEEYAEADNERARLLAGQTTTGGDRRSVPGSQNDVAGAHCGGSQKDSVWKGNLISFRSQRSFQQSAFCPRPVGKNVPGCTRPCGLLRPAMQR